MYRLRPSQSENDDKKYPYLAYELRNVFDAKTSFAFNVYSLRYTFKYLAIKISCIKY